VRATIQHENDRKLRNNLVLSVHLTDPDGKLLFMRNGGLPSVQLDK
jgi:hypothetical protein